MPTDTLRIQLWSYNYDPEPTGIGPVSKVWAEGLRDRGHYVEVVTAHPHYPAPYWGTCIRPYRERRNGITIFRLPLWIGRASTAERYRQELSFMAAQCAAAPILPAADVIVSTSPSFAALLPAMVNVRVRRIPWVIWLHDILPDGAAATGLINEGMVLRAARVLERAAYKRADRIVVLSRSFTDNLRRKEVPREKIQLIYDPATRVPSHPPMPRHDGSSLRILSMGNIGYSQGLAPLVQAFSNSSILSDMPVHMTITGNGVAAEDVRQVLDSDRVTMAGVVDDSHLEDKLQSASVGFVSQQHDGPEFNIPSKLMNFMAYGLPVIAAVNPVGEVARIVQECGGGWVISSSDPEAFPRKVAELARAPDEVRSRGTAALNHAHRHFTQNGFAERFERGLLEVTTARSSRA